MKLLHLGDLHLGKSLLNFNLIEDQRYILNQILDMIDTEEIDAVLIAGDIYDKSVPSEEAINLLDYFLKRLAQKNKATFLISGNHDSDDRLNFGSSLFEANNIFISAVYDGTLKKQTLTDEYGEVDIYMLPFVKASQVRHFHPEVDIKNYNDAVNRVFEHAEINPDRRNVILAHQFVVGRCAVQDSVEGNPKLAGSEGLSVQSVGLVEKINSDCFDLFDYAALGHIHSPQSIGREQVRYSGSPLKYSLSEVANEKSVPIITLGAKGEVDIKLAPLKPMRNLRHIKGNLRTLLDEKNIRDTEDFIYATLTDEEIVSDAMTIFQQYYPNTLRIDYDNAHTREITETQSSVVLEEKDFPELISEFYKFMYGCEISEDELELMKAVGKETGVYYEAD